MSRREVPLSPGSIRLSEQVHVYFSSNNFAGPFKAKRGQKGLKHLMENIGEKTQATRIISPHPAWTKRRSSSFKMCVFIQTERR